MLDLLKVYAIAGAGAVFLRLLIQENSRKIRQSYVGAAQEIGEPIALVTVALAVALSIAFWPIFLVWRLFRG